MNYQKENRVVHGISIKTIEAVKKDFGGFLKTKEKSHKKDLVSGLDIELNRLILAGLRKDFPQDKIASEESSPKLAGELSNMPRVWLIDPLCGSNNAARGVLLFVTNIVLIEWGRVKAAWVIDYSQGRVVWSTGGGRIYSGNTKLKRPSKKPKLITINTDWGYLFRTKNPERNPVIRRYADMVCDLLLSNDFEIHAYNSSFAFLYVATDQLQAALVPGAYPWDVLAASFLIEQNGGSVTNFDGSPWNVQSTSLVMSSNPSVHKRLMKLVRKHKLGELSRLASPMILGGK